MTRTIANRGRTLATVCAAVTLLAGCAVERDRQAPDAAANQTQAVSSPSSEQVRAGLAEIVLTDRRWPSFEAASANRVRSVADGSPLHVHIRTARPIGELAMPADPEGRYAFSPYPHLYLHVGDDASLISLNTCYITLSPEDLRLRELVVPLAPPAFRPGRNPTDCWLAVAASAKGGARTYELRLAGFVGRLEGWLPVADLLAVDAVRTDFSGGTARYSAMFAAGPEPAVREPVGPSAAAAATPARAPVPDPQAILGLRRPPAAPGQAPARVVIHHYTGDAAAVARARGLKELLETRYEFDVELRQVSAFVSADNIRIFFEADRQNALVARNVVGSGPVPIRNFSDYRPLPRPGTIELWLAAPMPGKSTSSSY